MSVSGEVLAPGARLQEFRIVRELGAGGFGITYLARDEALDRLVAVKEYMPRDWGMRHPDGTVGPRSSTSAADYAWGLERFLAEARLLARLDHRSIVKAHRIFETAGTAYMAMEYVEGRSLEEELRTVGPLPEARVRQVVEGVAAGLDVVHAAGLLHRDIKPANVMLREADGSPVLVDFGAARQQMGRQTQAFTAVLTPGYAPMEQYGSKGRQGPWTDVYALGAVAYEALTGRVPDQAPDRAITDGLPRVEMVAPHPVSGEMGRAVMAALAMDPASRPQTVAEWLEMVRDGPRGRERGRVVVRGPDGRSAAVGGLSLAEAQAIARELAGGGTRAEDAAPVASGVDRQEDGSGGGVRRRDNRSLPPSGRLHWEWAVLVLGAAAALALVWAAVASHGGGGAPSFEPTAARPVFRATADQDSLAAAGTELAERTILASQARAPIDFGDDSGEHAHDGQCDDNRFAGPSEHYYHWTSGAQNQRDASDCEDLFGAGLIELRENGSAALDGAARAEDRSALQSDELDAAPRRTDPVPQDGATIDVIGGRAAELREQRRAGREAAAGPDFGDDSGRRRHNGKCDDNRFVGPPEHYSHWISSVHNRRDASDCERLLAAGLIELRSGIDFGDDSGRNARNGKCDDNRFEGPSEYYFHWFSGVHNLRDASDCERLLAAGLIELRSGSR